MTDEAYKRDDIPDLYRQGHSLTAIAKMTGTNYSAVRRKLQIAGVPILSRKEGVARHPNGWNSNRIGISRPEFSQEWRDNMSKSAKAKWEAIGVKGFTVTKEGYVKFTTGPNVDRELHVVMMEERIGRRLLSDENVHHIDHDPSNNSEDNLALVTKSGHARLHRFEDKLAGKELNRDAVTGRFKPTTK